ncbi:MAG: AAA family ATPase, partial [Anaerolineae bacterium]
DNFVHTVLKTEEDLTQQWVSNQLTLACQEGFTLVYDEFTRSRPEANNVLLSVLEEKLLAMPAVPNKGSFMRVHPDFHALFTSNPEDYVGVHKSQDALLDRMITIDLDYFDCETETAITAARASISRDEAESIVNLVRAYRASGQCRTKPTVRKCLMIAKVMAVRHARASADDPIFSQICLDVLGSEPMGGDDWALRDSKQRLLIERLIDENCRPLPAPARKGSGTQVSNALGMAIPGSTSTGPGLPVAGLAAAG